MKRIGDWIQTYTGVIFYPLDPRPEEINIEDIAHSLSLQCRFAGHCREHYSVAQHSIIVAQNLPNELRLWGLLHDASEAYLVDLPRPIKRWCDMGRMYCEYEAALMRCVCERFNLAFEEPAEVKRMDTVLLVTEKRDLMTSEPKPWEDTETPLSRHIRPIPSSDAERLFLSVYDSLIQRKGTTA
jgi:uncharacterized protein